MNSIIKKFEADLMISNLSPSTQKHYLCNIKKFQEYFNKPANELWINEIKEFLTHLRYERKLAISTVNYYRNAIKYFYEVTLDKEWSDRKISRLKGYQSIPSVLSKEEVLSLINATENLKFKSILSIIYGSGLRVGEAAKLKICDIDSGRMQVYIRDGKCGSSRHTILSEKCLVILRKYIQEYFIRKKKKIDPYGWLFPGQMESNPISTRRIQHAIERARNKVQINKNVTIHTLRHSFATHLLESGVNIYYIKEILGHSSIRSTSIYLHMVDVRQTGLKSPLDEGGI